MDNGQGNRRIAINTVFLYIRMLIVLFISLYTSRVILRILGAEDYGIYNVVAGFVSMFAFLNTSMSNGIQRFYNFSLGKGTKVEYTISEVYSMAFFIQAIMTIVTILLVESFGIWYLETKMVIHPDRMFAARCLFQFSIVSMIILMMQIPFSAAVMAYEEMSYYALIGIVDVLLKLIICLLLPVINADKLVLYGLLLLLVTLIDFLLFFVFAKTKFKELQLKIRFEKNLFSSMFVFLGWNILGTFAFMMKSQGLNLVLNVFFGPIVNAARGISSQIMSALQSFSSNIVVAFRPQLVQSYAAGNYCRTRNIFFKESKITYILLLAMTIPVMIEIEYILNVWLGKDIIPDYTITFTILVLINMLISSFHTPLTQVVHATGRMMTYQIVISIIICSIIPISWLCLKLGCSPNSVFVVSLVITTINVITSLIIVHSLFKFKYSDYMRKVIIPCLITTVITPVLPFSVHLVLPSSFWRLTIVCFLDVISVAFSSYMLAFDKSEKEMVKSIVYKVIKR